MTVADDEARPTCAVLSRRAGEELVAGRGVRVAGPGDLADVCGRRVTGEAVHVMELRDLPSRVEDGSKK